MACKNWHSKCYQNRVTSVNPFLIYAVRSDAVTQQPRKALKMKSVTFVLIALLTLFSFWHFIQITSCSTSSSSLQHNTTMGFAQLVISSKFQISCFHECTTSSCMLSVILQILFTSKSEACPVLLHQLDHTGHPKGQECCFCERPELSSHLGVPTKGVSFLFRP